LTTEGEKGNREDRKQAAKNAAIKVHLAGKKQLERIKKGKNAQV